MISHFKEFQNSSQRGSEYVGDVRGKGLLIGLEVVKDRFEKRPGIDEISRINFAAFHKGLLTAYDGLRGNVFRLMPSLTLTEKDAVTGAFILQSSFGDFQTLR
jgi:4-aminobutyrate aminotransferase-like enzyme